MKIRRLIITTTKRHCRDYGNAEGGNEYHQFVDVYMLNVEENGNKIEEEIPISLIMFVLMLFSPMISWVVIFLYLFMMLVVL